MFRLINAIFFAAIMLCTIGALYLGGLLVYNVVIDGALWVKIVAAALFAMYTLVGWVTGGDEDGTEVEDNA